MKNILKKILNKKKTKKVTKKKTTPAKKTVKVKKTAKLSKIKRGSLKKGSIADITIFDPNKKFKFTKKMINSKSKNSPFLGKILIGKVFITIVNGKIIFDNRN